MKTVYRSGARTLFPLLLSVFWMACARPAGNEQTGRPVAQVPFRDANDSPGPGTAPRPSLSVPNGGLTQAGDVPFHAESLPAGTLFSVRLNDAISANGQQTNRTFTAVLDEPVMIDQKIVLPQGASVTGRVESAEGSPDRRSYFRLTLDSIELDGRDLSLNTSSLFAKGSVGDNPAHAPIRSKAVKLEPGRRLTFRLSEPLNISRQLAMTQRTNLSR